MIDKETEEVVWKVYPEFPFIEANQFGEIRTIDRWVTCKNGRKRLIKGRILKQYFYPNGYMFVHFSFNGKQINLLVHRVIATSFLPNPHNYPVVNHKDNNRANNALSNLEWCSREYNEDYKKNFGTSQVQIQGHHVFAVEVKTGKVLHFESQHEAARKLGVFQQDVSHVVKGKQKTAGGYLFTENESKITEEKVQEIKANMRFFGGVIAVDLETFTVLRFESQAEAERQLGVSHSHINEVIKGKRRKTSGYWFCYADEYAIEKTRAKFGDAIAEKVEELMYIS